MFQKPLVLVVLFVSIMMYSCQKLWQPNTPVDLQFEVPNHFPKPVYQSDKNPVTRNGFQLGKKLFYDPLLSRDGTISCGSCHHQESGFSDHGMEFSLGVDNKKGMRNSPALSNLAWNPYFMADGGVNHIEVMPLAPITDSLEMDQSIAGLLDKLKADPEYPSLFKRAFGTQEINDQRMLYALAQFMSMMISSNSKYDHFLQGVEDFTERENRGYELFKSNCSGCHKGVLTTDFSFRNNGLDVSSEDPGRARITLQAGDHGKFKVPSLRNVTLSSPYMHDGRMNTLKEVLDHYDGGIQANPNLDPLLEKGISLSENDKLDLIEFLKTLTDPEYLSNGLLAKPH